MAEPQSFLGGKVVLWPGDCMDVLAELPENSVDAVVTDPPYHLLTTCKRFSKSDPAKEKYAMSRKSEAFGRLTRGFMGQRWDGGDIAFRPETWAAVLRVMKPGAHLLAFAAPKNSHRMICAIEDAGLEIRDGLMWLFGSGFPKSHDISKAIDRVAGAEGEWSERVGETARVRGRTEIIGQAAPGPSMQYTPATPEAARWQGFGTALKPAYEPIVLARKPLSESSIAANVLRWGTGALNIDGCRVGWPDGKVPEIGTPGWGGPAKKLTVAPGQKGESVERAEANALGRWPANIITDGSDEVVGAFPETHPAGNKQSSEPYGGTVFPGKRTFDIARQHNDGPGSAARFFYTAKADQADRAGSRHPTVKPLDLIQYLCRLITPPGGTVLDPFSGTGTTGEAAWREGFRAILIEREAEYQADIARRMEWALMGPESRARAQVKLDVERGKVTVDAGPLFGGGETVETQRGRQIYGVFADEKGRPR